MSLLEDAGSWGGFKEYIDIESGLGRVMNNKKIYSSILKSFLGSSYFEEMRTQIQSNDLENAERSAHTIKGVAANLSLTALYETSVLIEKQLKEGSDTGQTLIDMEFILNETKKSIENLIAE